MRLKLTNMLLASALLAFPAQGQEACWDVNAPCIHQRFEGPSVVVDDLMYIFGGFDSPSIEATPRIDVYDPSLDTWSSRADMPILVTHAGFARDDRTVWVVAGFLGDHPGIATADTWMYDVDLDSWTPGPALPKAVAGGALVRFDRNLHWFGGVEADRDTNSADHYVLDLDNTGGGWSSLAPLPHPRNHLSGVRLGNFIHAMGGQSAHDTSPQDTDYHEAYDPTTDSWIEMEPLPMPRSHFEPGTIVYQGKAIIVSGKSTFLGDEGLIDVTEYDPVTDEWHALPPLPLPRFGVSAKIIQDRLIATTGSTPDLVPIDDTYSRPAAFSFNGHMRVNCGGGHYLDSQGEDWCSDVGYLNGEVFENQLIPDVQGTLDDELYLAHRTSDNLQPNHVSYRIPADEGKYRLVLHFAETFHGATGYGGPSIGQRVMRFVIEGKSVRQNVDVAKDFGVETAGQYVFDFEATGGDVTFHVISTVGKPMLAAFELIDLPDDAFERFCVAGPNSTGLPALISFKGSGCLSAGDFRLETSTCPPGQFGLYFYSMQETSVPFGNGTRCIDNPFYRLPAQPTIGGVITQDVDFGNLPGGGDILPGTTWSFQLWYRDPAAGGSNFDTSDALRMRFTN